MADKEKFIHLLSKNGGMERKSSLWYVGYHSCMRKRMIGMHRISMARQSWIVCLIVLFVSVEIRAGEITQRSAGMTKRFRLQQQRREELEEEIQCPFTCRNGSICASGRADFSSLPAVNFLQQPQDLNYYCEACPPQLTGILCDRPIQICSSSNPQEPLACFHGGSCVGDGTSSQQQVCDCRQALFQGRRYTGTYCERPVSTTAQSDFQLCNGLHTNIHFCLHGGSCAQEESSYGCVCQDGYSGPHCEFQGTQQDTSSTAGAAPLVCDLECLNGGTCEVTSFTIPTTTNSSIVYGNNHTNEATSRNLYCNCPDGYRGRLCETVIAPSKDNATADLFECSLPCKNGGVCQKGNKSMANLNATTTSSSRSSNINDNTMHDNFLQSFDRSAFEHCHCPSGYRGAYCEIQVEVCGQDQHLCLHGSKCLLHKDGEYRCDCQQAFTPESRFAGEFCQHHHTDVCTPTGRLQFTGAADDHAFCVNDGVCKTTKSGNGGHPGCDCGPDYYGLHCEFEKTLMRGNTNKSNSNNNSNENHISKVGVTMYSLCILIVLATFSLVGIHIRQKSRNLAVCRNYMKEEEFAFSLKSTYANTSSSRPCFHDEAHDDNTFDDVEII